jgi:hypothetical protein
MKFTFYIDRHNNQPHCLNRHGIETSLVLASFAQIVGREYTEGGAWVRHCLTPAGKVLVVVYKWDKKPTHVFVITAYYPGYND